MASFLQNATAGAQGLQNLEMNRMQMDQQQQQMQQQQRQQVQEDEGMQIIEQFKQGYQNGQPDYNLLITAAYKSPTAAKNILAGVGIVEENQKKQAANDIVTLTGSLDDPKSFYRATAQRIAAIKARGGDPSNTIEMAKRYQQGDVESVKNELLVAGAALANEGYIKPELIGLVGAKGQETPASQREFEYYQRLQQQNPEAAVMFAKSRGYIDSPREQAQTPQERNIATYKQMIAAGDPNAEAFGQSAGLLSKEGRELTAQTQKRLSEFNDAATTAATNVVKYNDLAAQFDQGVQGGVISGSWGEYFKDLTGNQDWKTELRKDFAQVRATEVVRNLPPGAASDADIAMALKPFPSDNASGEQVAAFLRGLSKLSAYNEQFNTFKADYISENGSERGMVDAWKKYAKANDVKPETPQRTLGKPVNIGGYSVVEVQ